MRGIFKIVGHSADTKTISVKFNRLHSQTPIDDYPSASVDYSNYDLTSIETFSKNLMRKSGQRRVENEEKKVSVLAANSPSNVSGKFSMDDLVGKVVRGDVEPKFKTTLSARKVEL